MSAWLDLRAVSRGQVFGAVRTGARRTCQWPAVGRRLSTTWGPASGGHQARRHGDVQRSQRRRGPLRSRPRRRRSAAAGSQWRPSAAPAGSQDLPATVEHVVRDDGRHRVVTTTGPTQPPSRSRARQRIPRCSRWPATRGAASVIAVTACRTLPRRISAAGSPRGCHAWVSATPAAGRSLPSAPLDVPRPIAQVIMDQLVAGRVDTGTQDPAGLGGEIGSAGSAADARRMTRCGYRRSHRRPSTTTCAARPRWACRPPVLTGLGWVTVSATMWSGPAGTTAATDVASASKGRWVGSVMLQTQG